jgi:hypothetical protein
VRRRRSRSNAASCAGLPNVSGAIEHFRPARLPALIELLGADVACTLRFSEGRRKHRGKGGKGGKCELMLANKTQATVSGRLYGIDRKRRTRDFGELTVIANGMGSSVFPLPQGAAACERVYLEVVGDGIRLSADARIVSKKSGFVWPILATSASVVALAATALIAAFFAERPVITAFAVPGSAAVGTVTATYATRGLSSGTYEVAAWDGTVLAAGALPGASGELPIVVPAKMAGQNVRLSVDLNGPFGHAQRDVSLAVLGAPPALAALRSPERAAPVPVAHRQARIAYFSAHRERYAGKTSVLASYQASGERGLLRIRNQHGTVLGTRAFSHVGTTRIPLAVDPGSQALRAEIEVTGGGTHSSAAVEIPSDAGALNAPAAPVVPAAPAAVAETVDDGGSMPTPSDPFRVEQRVVAGREFTIQIRRSLPNLRIGLQSTSGTTIDEVSVPAGARTVTLRAPASSMLEIYYLAGTFTRSSAEETLIRSLRIYPD